MNRRAVRVGVLIGLLALLGLGGIAYDGPPTEPSSWVECEQQQMECW